MGIWASSRVPWWQFCRRVEAQLDDEWIHGKMWENPLYKWRFIAGRINYNPDFVEVGFIVLVVG
jgi:hypothetical protein